MPLVESSLLTEILPKLCSLGHEKTKPAANLSGIFVHETTGQPPKKTLLGRRSVGKAEAREPGTRKGGIGGLEVDRPGRLINRPSVWR